MKTIEKDFEKTYWIVRSDLTNFFMHVSGARFRWTPTPYDATFFESEEDANRYLDIAEFENDDHVVRIVPMTMTFLG